MDDPRIIAERLRTLVERLRLAQSAFASQAAINPTNFSRMLKGEMRITEKTLLKIANKYNVHYDWLAYGKGEMMDLERLHDTEQSEMEVANEAFTIATDVLTKTLEEMKAQRGLTEKALKLLEDSMRTNAEQAQALLRLLNEKL